MKPGRELDALVAEKVMGWVPSKVYERNFLKPGCPIPFDLDDWKPSEDIAAAWEVFERTCLSGSSPLHGSVSTAFDGGFRATFSAYGGGGFHVEADGNTVPHAICLAALKAVGVDVEALA